MSNANSFLAEWSIRFLENKDIIRKEIVDIEKNISGFDFAIHYKDKAKYFVISPILGDEIFSSIRIDGNSGVITLNNLLNIRFVASNWKKLTDFKFLSIYFINPFSGYDKVWIISPYIHDKICDKASLELGLKSMAEMVAPLGVDELNSRIKLLREGSGL